MCVTCRLLLLYTSMSLIFFIFKRHIPYDLVSDTSGESDVETEVDQSQDGAEVDQSQEGSDSGHSDTSAESDTDEEFDGSEDADLIWESESEAGEDSDMDRDDEVDSDMDRDDEEEYSYTEEAAKQVQLNSFSPETNLLFTKIEKIVINLPFPT